MSSYLGTCSQPHGSYSVLHWYLRRETLGIPVTGDQSQSAKPCSDFFIEYWRGASFKLCLVVFLSARIYGDGRHSSEYNDTARISGRVLGGKAYSIVSLDVRKTFDTVSHCSIARALGVPDTLHKYIVATFDASTSINSYFCIHSLESNASNIQRSLRNESFPVDSNVKIAKNIYI
jgi:hypothetical protein